jgi:very-short-patch-repair endonuclease
MQTSYGQQLIREFINATIDAPYMENQRPEWLNVMELDFYFANIKMAIEFQGGQHEVPVYGYANLKAQRARDADKRAICAQRGITLISMDASDLKVGRFRSMLKQRGFADFLRHVSRANGLDAIASKYRQSLKSSFGCPTAHKKKSRARFIVKQAHFL